MVDKNMTDNEIIKALEHCKRPMGKHVCEECPFVTSRGHCSTNMLNDTIDLINRQKAEIERLEKENKLLTDYSPANRYGNCVLVKNGEVYTKTLEDYDRLIGDISAETVKEFAEKAVDRVEKAKAKYQRLCKEQGEEMEEHMHIHFNGIIGIIRNLLKEMVGEGE